MRPFVWLCRFRHRCGYGVHSPFAFEFITRVIYERTPYYKYEDLKQEQKKLAAEKGRHWAKRESTKVKQFLFRLVNRVQPATVVDVGASSAASLYLKAAKVGADYLFAADRTELFLESGVPVDFLYLHDYRQPELMQQVFDICAARSTERSVFVVEGIGYTKKMRALWKTLQQAPQVGITFDLYDLGILFFDRSKIKQDYIVNF